MSTSTISKPSAVVLFVGRSELRLVKRKRFPIRDSSGAEVDMTPGEAFAFRDGTLRIPEGKVTLEGGATMPRDEALAWLRGHKLYGNPSEGFLELTPAAPAVSEAEMDAVLEVVWDEEALLALIAAEEAGWARDALLRPARKALERLREALRDAGVDKDADGAQKGGK